MYLYIVPDFKKLTLWVIKYWFYHNQKGRGMDEQQKNNASRGRKSHQLKRLRPINLFVAYQPFRTKVLVILVHQDALLIKQKLAGL